MKTIKSSNSTGVKIYRVTGHGKMRNPKKGAALLFVMKIRIIIDFELNSYISYTLFKSY